MQYDVDYAGYRYGVTLRMQLRQPALGEQRRMSNPWWFALRRLIPRDFDAAQRQCTVEIAQRAPDYLRVAGGI
jgi:hypothetical protein